MLITVRPTVPLPPSVPPAFTAVRIDDAIEPSTIERAGVDRRGAEVGVGARQRRRAGADLDQGAENHQRSRR